MTLFFSSVRVQGYSRCCGLFFVFCLHCACVFSLCLVDSSASYLRIHRRALACMPITSVCISGYPPTFSRWCRRVHACLFLWSLVCESALSFILPPLSLSIVSLLGVVYPLLGLCASPLVLLRIRSLYVPPLPRQVYYMCHVRQICSGDDFSLSRRRLWPLPLSRGSPPALALRR